MAYWKLLAVGAVAAFAAACATTEDGATEASDATDSAQVVEASSSSSTGDDQDEIVCRRIASTGSRLKERICHTKREWREIEERSREMMEEQSRRRGTDSLPAITGSGF